MEATVEKKTRRRPLYTVTIQVEASQLATVRKKADEAFPGAVRSCRHNDPVTSRADRLASLEADRDDVLNGVDELREELQEWHDNLPENLQQGDKGSELEEAISALDEIKDGLEGVDFGNVSFPSMMG